MKERKRGGGALVRQARGIRAIRLVAFAPLLVAASSCKHAPPERAAADVILFAGRVYTADPQSPWAEAVAIRRDRIIGVGSSAAVTSLAGSQTLMIDLGHRVAIPGINDAHDHLADAPFGVRLAVDPSPTPDPGLSAVVDSVRSLVQRYSSGTWIQALVGMRVLGDAAAARVALDGVAPDHPVLLFAWWGHGVIVNSRGLRDLKISDDAPDPLGGRYERDREGQPAGKLEEYAGWSALRYLHSNVPADAIAQHLQRYASARLRYGVTSVQDMSSYLEPVVAVRAFRAARLPIRVRVIRWPMPDARSLHADEWASVDEHPAPRTAISGTKWVLDGTPIEQLAFRSTPYPNRLEWRGRLNFPDDTIRAIIARAAHERDQLMLHAVGDATAEVVLTRMEAEADPTVWRPRRVRLEHANGIIGRQVERARRLGIVIAQPRANSPWRTWLAAGIPVAYGSDGNPNPFETMFQATTSSKAPSEAISREEAVTMMTRASAYAEFKESEKGMLALGMLADLTVLSQDIFTVALAALPETKSVLTMVGGETVFDAGVLKPQRECVASLSDAC